MQKRKWENITYVLRGLFLSTVLLFNLGGAKVVASENSNPLPIGFQVAVRDFDPTMSQGEHPRTPIARPKVTLDDHTLYIQSGHGDWTLQLVDEDDNVVFATIVPAGVNVASLPATLSGDYQLEIYPDGSSYYFYSEITL